jgi:protein-L-isoaspartate(D-aspartate) O-methyltransferase
MPDDEDQIERWLAARRQMVEDQIRRRGISDPRVLHAMLTVPREIFVSPADGDAAYDDRALPIACGQTISQPYIVAYMTEQLAITPDDRVLEIGTGSGYQTAILAMLARHVFTVERITELQQKAAVNLAQLNVPNVTMSIGDGSMGLDIHAPYDRIIVTAAAPRVPTPLINQLVHGGILVIPVGGKTQQTIVRVVREDQKTIETSMLACRFVKLIGRDGWDPDRAD